MNKYRKNAYECVCSFKSRSSTPLKDFLRSGVSETLQLLQKWNLLELQNIFKEHDITLRSLIYLTDDEICELIPKIGVRTIFRAMLKEWRQTYINVTCPQASISSYCDEENDSYLDHIELKTECNSEDFNMNTYSKDKTNCESEYLNTLQQTSGIEQSLDGTDNESVHSQVLKTTNPNTKNEKSQLNYKGEPFNVLAILSCSTDGQTVLEFYKINQFLDIKNRKRVVSLLIRAVVERKVEKYTAIFHDMTRQLLELFPTEKYETYFVPHNGPSSARGALYYRYSNYTRQLRKEGLLAYKKHKPKTYIY